VAPREVLAPYKRASFYFEMKKYHQAVQKIISLLEEKGVAYETFEHESVRTSEEAAKIRVGYSLKQGAKAVVLRVKERGGRKYFAMIVLPGDKRFDNQKVKKSFGAKDIRFATEKEVVEVTNGVLPGGVPPFGQLFGLKVVVDPGLLRNERIIFNAGDKRFSIAMKSKDYLSLVKPEVVDIT
jgi:Ala-tRNA(Pro) deacylase